jgi:hypothetical protein
MNYIKGVLFSTWEMIQVLTDNPNLQAKLMLDGENPVHDNLTVRISNYGHIYHEDSSFNVYTLSIHHKWQIIEVQNYRKEE